MRQFDIIGAGMGTRETLTGEAAQALASAEMVFATERLAEICENAQICLFSELAERAIACGADRAALLVSGDVGFFSAAGKLREKLLAHGEVRLFCGLSSMQYLCAKIGISYENACIRSLHGRKGDLLGAVSYHEKTFALTGGDNNVQFVCRSLADAGLGGVQVYIGENLGSPGERVLKGTASELAEIPCADLAVMLVLNPNSVNPFEPVRDEMLTRAKVPMTKEEVRWVSVARLGVQPGDTVWLHLSSRGKRWTELSLRSNATRKQSSLLRRIDKSSEGLMCISSKDMRPKCLQIFPDRTVFLSAEAAEICVKSLKLHW